MSLINQLCSSFLLIHPTFNFLSLKTCKVLSHLIKVNDGSGSSFLLPPQTAFHHNHASRVRPTALGLGLKHTINRSEYMSRVTEKRSASSVDENK